MLVQVKVPALSESVAEATLLSWHKKQGDYVKRDENLIDIETDKVVLELPAPNSGVLKKIVKGDGGTLFLLLIFYGDLECFGRVINCLADPALLQARLNARIVDFRDNTHTIGDFDGLALGTAHAPETGSDK